MGKLLGVFLGALAIGIVIGVVFQFTYPATEISPDLGLLFALVGLILSGSPARCGVTGPLDPLDASTLRYWLSLR